MYEKELKKLFPFEYVGGGYFREIKSQGEKAKILHGMEAIKYIIERLENERF